MDLQIADYVLLALALVLVVLGLFRGLSGTLAFFIALAAATAAGRFGWAYAGGYVTQTWVRFTLVAAGALIAFGLVRACVTRCVHCLLDQPADALFGALAGLAGFLLVVYAWAYLAVRTAADWPQLRDCSVLIRLAASYVG